MAKVTAEEYQEKHARRLKGAITDIQRGVDRVTVNPCDLAAAKADKMLARLSESVQSGKWARNLKKVTLDDWKSKMKDKGVPRISGGIDGAKEKVIAFAKDLLPHVDTGVAAIKKLPDLTIDDSINRAATFIRHMADFKK